MTKVAFLHIPKTAGQSVHQFLEDTFGAEGLCPIRVNSQINADNEKLLGGFDVVSGHLDWDKILKHGSPEFTFTVLRDPKERILSFYHYLRSQARKLDSERLKLPEFTGMNAALTLSPDDYFCNVDGELRTFIDDHYDNFYSYYFAYKKFSGRREALFKLKHDRRTTLKLAIQNLLTLDGVYFLDNWEDLAGDLRSRFSLNCAIESQYHVNKGDKLTADERLNELHNIGPAENAIQRIEEMCEMDNVLYQVMLGIRRL